MRCFQQKPAQSAPSDPVFLTSAYTCHSVTSPREESQVCISRLCAGRSSGDREIDLIIWGLHLLLQTSTGQDTALRDTLL